MKLVKNGDDWRKWVVLLGEEVFFLEHADHADTDLYEIPGNREKREVIWSQIENLKFTSIPNEIKLSVSKTKEIINAPVTYAFIHKDKSTNQYKLEIYWTIQLNHWNSTQNPILIQKEIIKIHQEYNKENIEILDDSDVGLIDIYFTFKHDGDETIGFALQEAKSYIESLQARAIKNISNKKPPEIIASFEFNPEIQGSCSRYLLYFVEFLRDMGIEANSELNKKGNEILFSIEPTDKEASLERIKDALAFYLAIPESNGHFLISNSTNPITEFKIEKLNAEVQALKSSIKIYEALIHIQSKSNSLEIIQTHDNGGKSPANGLKSVSTPSSTDSKVEFFNGFIRLGKFQKFGIEIDWNALRWLSKK